MSDVQPKFAVIFGGWYQRTTLHLTEVYDFLSFGRSHPELDQTKLASLHNNLNLKAVNREAGYLEYIQAKTMEEITVRYYEDGLYVLELESADIKSAQRILQDYYCNSFEPATSYIFSLGAPIPKILANIKTVHPIVVSATLNKPGALAIDAQEFGQVYSQITSNGVTVYKTPQYIFIATASKEKIPVFDLMEMQIFFREFKDQLAKYLDIHRKVWEDIEKIKERQVIKGYEIGPLRARLDAYQKTVNLIGNRINQMGAYVRTRSSIARDLAVENHLKTLFQYKFEVLENTLSYIKEIWSMTKEYLASAIGVLKEQETQATTNSIKSLSVITSVGVVSGLVVHLTRKDLPLLTLHGLAFFGFLIIITWLLNLLINRFYKNLKYRLKFTDSAAGI